MQKYLQIALTSQIILSHGAVKARPNTPLKACSISYLGKHDFGPDYELLKPFSKYIGKKIKPVQITSWTPLVEKDKSGKQSKLLSEGVCDFYAISMTLTPERLDYLNMVPFVVGRTLVVVKKNNAAGYRGIESLAGKKTKVVKDTSYHHWITKLNADARLKNSPIKVLFCNPGEAISSLLNGESDFLLLDTAQALSATKEHPGQLTLSFPMVNNERIGWAFNPKEPKLAAQFHAFVSEQKLTANSDMNSSFKKFYGVSVKEYESLIFYSQSTVNENP